METCSGRRAEVKPGRVSRNLTGGPVCVTHRSLGEDGDQRPVVGAVALAQVVQSRLNDVRGEVWRVGSRIQFPERRPAVILSSPIEDLCYFCPNKRWSFSNKKKKKKELFQFNKSVTL